MFHGRVADQHNSHLSQIMTPSGVVQNEDCSKTPRVGALGLRVPDDVEGYAVEPESRGGRDGSRCTSRRYRVPMPAPVPVPQIVVATAPVDRAASRLYIRRADVQKYGYSMNCLGCRSVMTNTTARAHTEECRRRLENCLAEDEETKFRSEAPKLRVEGWRVESNQQINRVVVTLCPREPSGAASSSAPAAAASSSAPAVASSSSAAAERFRSDEVRDHGVKRVRWWPHVQGTSELDPSEGRSPSRVETTTRVRDGGSGRRR